MRRDEARITMFFYTMQSCIILILISETTLYIHHCICVLKQNIFKSNPYIFVIVNICTCTCKVSRTSTCTIQGDSGYIYIFNFIHTCIYTCTNVIMTGRIHVRKSVGKEKLYVTNIWAMSYLKLYVLKRWQHDYFSPVSSIW